MMNTGRPALLKRFTDRLAEVLDSPDGAKTVTLLQQLKLMSEARAPTSPNVDPDRSKSPLERVGVWERETEKDEFYVRSPCLKSEWSRWADVERIRVHAQADKRIVLLGESVARGYLHEPHYRPAQVLESVLGTTKTFGSIEVVDLARVGLSMSGLCRLMHEAKRLRPDAVVIFAGNNWFHGLVQDRGEAVLMLELAEALRREGVGGATALLERAVRARVKRFMAFCAETFDIPVVFVLPEFNLLDWKCAGWQRRVPWLPANKARLWLQERERADRAFAQHDFGTAASHAMKMSELDEGLSGAGLHLLAECKVKMGEKEEARALFEKARDAVVLDDFPSPRIFSCTQQLLRECAADFGVRLVDLPRVFGDYLAGELPDRRLFLDYCHHTEEGIRLAMSATAEALLQTAGETATCREVLSGAPRANDEVRADAHFMAAIHNAHLGQGYDICLHHCLEALKLNSDIAEQCLDYLDAKMRPIPDKVCKSFARVCQSSRARSAYLVGLQPADDLMEAVLIRVFSDALSARGIDISARVHDLLCAEHAVGEKFVDLLSPRYSQTFYATDPLEPAYYRAWDVRSRFFFVCEAARDFELEITSRVPCAKGPEVLRLEVNGQALDALDSTASWSSRSLHVPERMLRKGLNELLIQWPLPSALGEDACVRAAEQIELGQHCELFPWFGELHRLRTRRSKSAQVGLGERNSQSAHVLPDVMGTAAQHYVTQSF